MSNSRLSDDQGLVDGWLRMLGQQTGIDLRLDDDGVCAVGHVSGLSCAVEVPPSTLGAVYLRVPLMPWDRGASVSLAEHCLSEHFLGLATQGASFAIDSREAELLLWKSIPVAALDAQQFAAAVVDLLDAAARWRERLQEFVLQPDACARAAGSESLPNTLA